MPEQTATNPQTGERVVLRNGQWVPLGQPASPMQQAPSVPQGGQDPIVRPAPTPAPPNPVSVAAEKRQTEQNTFRVMSPEEVRAAGLPGTAYQINGLGEIKPIGGEAPRPQMDPAEQQAGVARTLRSVIERIDQVALDSADNNGWFETGATGAMVANVPGTAAKDLRANIQTIDANSAFMALQQMRDNSPTGGALGQITERELDLLRSTIANLDPDQSQASFISNLTDAKRTYLEMLRRVDPAAAEEFANRPGIRFDPDGSGYLTTVTGPDTRERADPFGVGTAPPPADGGGSPTPDGGATRTGLSATILGDGTRSIPQQLGAGVGDMVQGFGDVLGLVVNPVGQMMNNALGIDQQYDTGQTLRAATGLPDNPNELQSAINRGATGALTFGGAARGLANVATNATARGALTTVGQSPVRDAAAGASAGAGAYAARDQNPVVQGAAALGAGMLGYGAAGMVPGARAAARPTTNNRAAAQEVIDAGQRENVRVMTSDVVPPRTPVGNAARNSGESIPYAGTGGARVAQQAERQAAVENVAREYGALGDSDHIAAISADLVSTRGKALTALTDRKNTIIDGTPGVVPAPRAVSAINRQIAELNGINPQQFAPLVRELETFRDVLSSGKSLRQVEENRRLLGEMLNSDGLAAVRDKGQKVVRAIYGPLREDMVEFVRGETGDAAAQQLEKVNERLAGMVGELDATNFRRALNQADTTPETAARLLFSANESDVRRLVQNLSPTGRQHAQSAIIYRALESAGDVQTVAGLSPQKFANAIQRYSRNIGIVFNQQDAARLQGLQRLLQATQRAADASLNPPTGIRNNVPILAAVLADLMGGAGAGLTTAGAGGLLARLYESAAVRNRLIGLSRSKPGSEQEARTIDGIARIMASQPSFREAFVGSANDNLALPENVAAGSEDSER